MTSPLDSSDERLCVESIRRGDPRAFDAVFREYYPALCAFTASYVGSPQVAEELVQEVFADLWQRRSALNSETLIKPFLYRAVKNQAMKSLRRRSVEDRSSKLAVAVLYRAPRTPEENFRYEQLADVVKHSIEDLPERCREVFLLSRKSGLSYAEVADVLEISVKTVETQMGRALKAIRTALRTQLG